MSTRALLRFKRPSGLDGELAKRIADALSLSWPKDADDDSNSEPVWVTEYPHDREIQVAVAVPGTSTPLDPAMLAADEAMIVRDVVAGRETSRGGRRRKLATRE